MTSPRFTIYCHTNRVNGKRYVGQTVYSMEKRWMDHTSLAKMGIRRGQVFANAIRKYGVDAFDHRILEVALTQEEANTAETRWIAELNCLVPNGYNLKSGGGNHGHHHEDTKRLMGKASRARWQKMTPEERAVARSVVGKSLRKWWGTMTVEERDVAKHTRAERLRTWWEGMSAEERSARQIVRQGNIPQEQRRATAAKMVKTRLEKYGRAGVRRVRSPAEHGESIKKGWAGMTPEARAERVRKIKEGVRKGWAATSPEARTERGRKVQEGRRARAVKTAKLVRINLLRVI
jgi:group I intron endonuclease